jgi:hypothetical protein
VVTPYEDSRKTVLPDGTCFPANQTAVDIS